MECDHGRRILRLGLRRGGLGLQGLAGLGDRGQGVRFGQECQVRIPRSFGCAGERMREGIAGADFKTARPWGASR